LEPTNFIDEAVNAVGAPHRTYPKSTISLGFVFGKADALWGVVFKTGGFVRTLVIGLVLAIVFLATYFVSTMERIW
jgi:hypothetical protein